MRIIQHTIQPGSNDIIPLTTEYVDRVEFETNESAYSLSFSKMGREHAENYLETQTDKIDPSIFMCGNGLTHLIITASCSGVLTLYFSEEQRNDEKNSTMSEIEQFKQRSRDKHYNRFLNNGVLTYSILKDFQYHISDKLFLSYFQSLIKHNFEQVSKIKLHSGISIVTSITVTSSKDTKCKLFNDSYPKITSFDIKTGTHTYPLVIPVYACLYGDLNLGFNDIVDCKINFFMLSVEYLRLLEISLPDYGATISRGSFYL